MTMPFHNHFANIPTLLFFLFSAPVFGQKITNPNPIVLENPSFEGFPQPGRPPENWFDCGKRGETPPDTQPGAFSVKKQASHGTTYLGLVVRDNETWEGVSQKLTRPLEINQCYELSLDLAQSVFYISLSKTTGMETNFAEPVILQIYGGYGYCDRKELLAQTGFVNFSNWKTIPFRLSPKKGNYTYLIIQAYFTTSKKPLLEAFNGNILLDNASPIRPIPCQEKIAKVNTKPPVATTPTPPKPEKKETRKKQKEQEPPISQTETSTPPPEPTHKFDRENIQKGLSIPVENIYFPTNKFEIKPKSEAGLQEIFQFLVKNSDVKIEIGGHTNSNCDEEFCNELSENRARAVMDWLVNQGISPDRLQAKGHGKNNLIIQNDDTTAKKQINQRVEIKILEMKN